VGVHRLVRLGRAEQPALLAEQPPRNGAVPLVVNPKGPPASSTALATTAAP